MQVVEYRHEFLGSQILTEFDSRTQLPFLRPDEPFPIWQIIKKCIGQDIMRVSMPVIINEPLSAL